MIYNTFGNTGLQVSKLGFGCGGFWGHPVFDERKAIALVHKAIEQGINYFDTGPSYSRANAEPRLGKALKGQNTDNLIISTKVGSIYRNGRVKKDFSIPRVRQQVENSLKILNLQILPCVLLHSPRPHDITDDLFYILEILKKEGKVKFWGASVDGATFQMLMNQPLIEAFMVRYNLLDTKALPLMSQAQHMGKAVILKSPLAHNFYDPAFWKIRSLSQIWYILRALKNHRTSLIQARKFRFLMDYPEYHSQEIALHFALDSPAHTAVIGTTKTQNLTNNIKALDKTIPEYILDRIKTS